MHCLISDFEHLSEFLLFICSAPTFPCIFWMISCLVQICCNDSFDVTSQCKLYTTGLYKTHLYYFKCSFYCLLHIKSIAALTPLFFGGFLAHVCRPQGPLADTGHVCITQTLACVAGGILCASAFVLVAKP